MFCFLRKKNSRRFLFVTMIPWRCTYIHFKIAKKLQKSKEALFLKQHNHLTNVSRRKLKFSLYLLNLEFFLEIAQLHNEVAAKNWWSSLSYAWVHTAELFICKSCSKDTYSLDDNDLRCKCKLYVYNNQVFCISRN